RDCPFPRRDMACRARFRIRVFVDARLSNRITNDGRRAERVEAHAEVGLDAAALAKGVSSAVLGGQPATRSRKAHVKSTANAASPAATSTMCRARRMSLARGARAPALSTY